MTKEHSTDGGSGEIAALIGTLQNGGNMELAIIVVPSHDRDNRELPAALTAQWAEAGMKLLADLYRGGTSFRAEQGIFKSSDGRYLTDKPVLLESYASEADIQNPTKLRDVLSFAKRMGQELRQEAVMLVFGSVMYYVEDYANL